MGSLATALLTRVRTHLEESSANEFNDNDQLYPYISDGHDYVAGQLASIDEAGWFEKEDTVTVSASAESASLPSDFQSMILCEWLDSNSVRHDLRRLNRAQITQMRTVSAVAGDVQPGYWLLQNTIHVLPISSSARTLKVTYKYDPAVITSASTLETPTRYDHIVALYAAIRALADDGHKDDVWNQMLQGFVADMIQRETSRADRGHGQSVENVYTSDQY